MKDAIQLARSDQTFSALLREVSEDVWDQIGPRTDEVNRARVKEAVADAIASIVDAGQRSPELIFRYALWKAKAALI